MHFKLRLAGGVSRIRCDIDTLQTAGVLSKSQSPARRLHLIA